MIATFEQSLEGQPTYAIGMVVGLAELVAGKAPRRSGPTGWRCKALAAALATRRCWSARQASAAPRWLRLPRADDERRGTQRGLGQCKACAAPSGRRPGRWRSKALVGMFALMAARAGFAKVTTLSANSSRCWRCWPEGDRRGTTAMRTAWTWSPSHPASWRWGVDIEAPCRPSVLRHLRRQPLGLQPAGRTGRRAATALPTGRAHRARGLRHPRGPRAPGPLRARGADRGFSAGFDLTPFSKISPRPRCQRRSARPDLALLSGAGRALPLRPWRRAKATCKGRTEASLVAAEDAVVTGDHSPDPRKLELDAQTVLEARPEAPGATSFASPVFWPLPSPVAVRRGEPVRVCAAHTASTP